MKERVKRATGYTVATAVLLSVEGAFLSVDVATEVCDESRVRLREVIDTRTEPEAE
ncbi:MAG: hypothetical protein SV760_02570 [Halobacteria archaeon]|nr:hypothetical protein [Halobacteria archaeon]